MLEARDISIGYGARAVVRGVSLRLESGRIIALLGANGAGKTTLLKALNGSLPVAAGAILLDGRPLAEHSRREIARRIAVVAQETETRFPVSVIEYVLAGRFAQNAGAFGWETEKDWRVAADCLALCDLAADGARLMNHLSGGERQRAVLARALATESSILLLDEPTNNLDLAHQALMLRLVRERAKGCGAGAIVITHDLNLAAEFADEALLLDGGAIVAQGAPREVFTAENLRRVFGVRVLLDEHPASGKLRVTPVYE